MNEVAKGFNLTGMPENSNVHPQERTPPYDLNRSAESRGLPQEQGLVVKVCSHQGPKLMRASGS